MAKRRERRAACESNHIFVIYCTKCETGKQISMTISQIDRFLILNTDRKRLNWNFVYFSILLSCCFHLIRRFQLNAHDHDHGATNEWRFAIDAVFIPHHVSSLVLLLLLLTTTRPTMTTATIQWSTDIHKIFVQINHVIDWRTHILLSDCVVMSNLADIVAIHPLLLKKTKL